MNRLQFCISLTAITLFGAGQSSANETQKPKPSILGSWELIEGTGYKKNYLHVRHLTDTHDSWVYYDARRELPIATAGGAYKMVGDKYTIKFDYASEGYRHLIGRPHTLTYKIENELLKITGKLANGVNITQTWKKI